MAQLRDDCFAVSGALLPLDDMERLIADGITPVDGAEEARLTDALGRIVAEDIVSGLDLPPFDNSAVDGYAVRHADLKGDGDTRLRVTARLAAGAKDAPVLGRNEAIRIFTGAPMPQGADTVFMQEDCRVDGDDVVLPEGLAHGANCRAAGEDIARGACALPAGRRITPADIALAAAIGMTAIKVRRRVRVAIFSTGDEVVEPGRALPGAAIYDANRHLLAALLTRMGAAVTDLGILADTPELLARALAAAAPDHDLVLTSGGVSTGEADYVRTAVESIGRLAFWRVAIKPGRPVTMGTIGNGAAGDATAVFVGLPGNPAAVYVTFAKVVRPLLMRLAGASPRPLIALPVRSAFSYRKRSGRREYVRVSLRRAADGAYEAVKHAQEGAGVITSLTETDGLAELMEDCVTVKSGDMIGFIPHATLTA